jgi:hypothetical protein
MEQISGRRIFWIGLWLERLKTDCLLKGSGSGGEQFPVALLHRPLEGPERKHALDILSEFQILETVGMPISAETMKETRNRIEKDADNKLSYDWLMGEIVNIQKMIEKEMKGKFFVYITPERVPFFGTREDPHYFGPDTIKAFGSASYDAWEASRCMGFMRHTAAVFHLMRVLETGLAALGKLFNVSLAHTNWGPAIEEIESKIRGMHKDQQWKSLSDCKDQQEAYSQIASHFGVLKDAWRNFTMHKRGMYGEDEAALIFRNVKAFMDKLARKGLSE